MKLIIVESPTKAKTISGFLKVDDYQVISSNGHVRDLPKSKLGIEVENNFKPLYIIPLKKRKNVNNLKKIAQEAEHIYLATDEDREGEAIAWHLAQILSLREIPRSGINSNSKAYQRIVFHEITKEAVEEALKNPREIDLKLVDAQQARRILDRLVGYTLSPILWEKIAKKLSAGRVQSPALRLIAEREREIEKFQSEKYFNIIAKFQPKADPPSRPDRLAEKIKKESKISEFEASLTKIDNQSIEKPGLKDKEKVFKILEDLKKAKFIVKSLEKKEVNKNPPPPLTTSTLQQEANNKLGFSIRQTMLLAQNLYETGLITYMRTDSLNLSEKFLNEASDFIEHSYGKNFKEKRRFKTKIKGAQEAHEAIRPVSVFKTPEEISAQGGDKNQAPLESSDEKLSQKNGKQTNTNNGFLTGQAKLYKLIWLRALASQMTQAKFETITCEIEAEQYLFKSTGSLPLFLGWLLLYPEKQKENPLPALKTKDEVYPLKIELIESETKPPSRFSEASLVKMLESLGIGRPSTYVPIIETLKGRNYVIKENRYLKPTEIGFLVNDLLNKHFSEIVDFQFTAQMEENLDKIAAGEKDWVSVIKNFYVPFKEKVEKKEKEIKKNFIEEKTNEVCPNCGKPLIIKMSRFGKFLACTGFPECRFTKSLTENKSGLEIKCPKCQEGEIIKKRTKKGRFFFACNQWPKCDFALWDEPINEFCPKCHSILVKTKKGVVKCSNKKCLPR